MASAPNRAFTPLERALRRRSRAALYGSLAVTAVAAWAAVASLARQAEVRLAPRWLTEKLAERPEVDLLRRYLRIDTSQPDANERAGALFLRGLLAERGIPSTLDAVDDRRANLLAVIEGERREAVVLHHHIDTDPVPDPSAWEHPPFAAEIDGPVLHGRGAFDMKSVGVAQLLAFLDVASSAVPPKRSVVLLATGGEEVGSEWGTQRILERHPDLVARTWVLLTEGGVVEALNAGDIKYWGIETAQRRVVNVRYAGPRDAIEALRREIWARASSAPPFVLTPEVEEFFRAYAASRFDPALRAMLADPPRLLTRPDVDTALPHFLRALLANDVFAGPLEDLPAAGEAAITLRLLLRPGQPTRPALDDILPEGRWPGLAREVREPHPPSRGSSPAHPAFAAIRAAIAEAHPGVPSGPFVLGQVVTDARFARARGIAAFGFSPFPMPATETLRNGRTAEQISLEGYIEGVETYRRLVRRLAGLADTAAP